MSNDRISKDLKRFIKTKKDRKNKVVSGKKRTAQQEARMANKADNIMRREKFVKSKFDIQKGPLGGAQSVPGGLSKKDIKGSKDAGMGDILGPVGTALLELKTRNPITKNMGGQVDGVEDLTTEIEIVD